MKKIKFLLASISIFMQCAIYAQVIITATEVSLLSSDKIEVQLIEVKTSD